MHSPLLNDNDIYNSKKILFNIYQSVEKPLIVEELEELDKFMDKFETSDIEVIWGLAEDENLKDEVKITVLATGFGMGNIPGMEEAIEARNVQERIISERERQEREEEEQAILEKFYGKSKLAPKRTVRSFIMQEADMDNDTLIYSIENSPTYLRTSKELSELENKRQEQESPKSATEGDAEITTIVF